MNKKHRYFHFLLIIICICFSITQQASYGEAAAKTAAVKTPDTPGPYRSTGFPQIVVVSGTNYEMGVQYGEQATPAIIHNLAIFKSMLYKNIEGGEKTVTADMQAWNHYLMQYDPTLKRMVGGDVAGVRKHGAWSELR